ncbi:MAG TPA: hypothetical protein VNM92_05985 [Thermoanaerobaculia bacterium]|nr:hypothetical protein [Thermoanaerobaculia bacterium]
MTPDTRIVVDDEPYPTDPLTPGLEPRGTVLSKIDFREWFGNASPVLIEIGSGKGRFLVDSALEDPDRNYVGIEKSLHYYRFIIERVVRRGIPNVRAIHLDAYMVLRDMVASESVDEFHIYFPDPWPRPRERKRRMIRDEVCQEMVRCLSPGGTGIYVTDHKEYFDKAVPVLERHFAVALGREEGIRPRTNYEAKYIEQGREIYQARFRRRSS